MVRTAIAPHAEPARAVRAGTTGRGRPVPLSHLRPVMRGSAVRSARIGLIGRASRPCQPGADQRPGGRRAERAKGRTGMKRRAGGTAPGTDPGDAMDVMSGATAAGPMATKPANDAGSNADTAYNEPTDKVDGEEHPDKTGGVDEPVKTDDASEPDKTAAPDQTEKPEPTEAPAPESKTLELVLALDGRAVVIEWSACDVDGFLAYKVVRSKDEHANWPLGAGDSLAPAIGDASTTRFVDADVDAGRTYTYRVIALREWNGETVAGCSSYATPIAIPAPTSSTTRSAPRWTRR